VVTEITGGGAHVSVDALGSPALAAVGALTAAPGPARTGRALLRAGPVPLPMDLVHRCRELEIYGSHGMAAATTRR